jgi:hypothetical protein
MKNQNHTKVTEHEITTFPLGYFAENDLVPHPSEKISQKTAFENFETNWKQLVDDSSKSELEGYYLESEDLTGR